MAWTRHWIEKFARLRDAARRELLRDPTVTLFERAGDPVLRSHRDGAGR